MGPDAVNDADINGDDELRPETDEALALTGKDVGTPIIHLAPPGGALGLDLIEIRLLTRQCISQESGDGRSS
jgi:hypothetical protein